MEKNIFKVISEAQLKEPTILNKEMYLTYCLPVHRWRVPLLRV